MWKSISREKDKNICKLICEKRIKVWPRIRQMQVRDQKGKKDEIEIIKKRKTLYNRIKQRREKFGQTYEQTNKNRKFQTWQAEITKSFDLSTFNITLKQGRILKGCFSRKRKGQGRGSIEKNESFAKGYDTQRNSWLMIRSIIE